ncbi:unnamed protein product, partial [Iphiclides podalirius]
MARAIKSGAITYRGCSRDSREFNGHRDYQSVTAGYAPLGAGVPARPAYSGAARKSHRRFITAAENPNKAREWPVAGYRATFPGVTSVAAWVAAPDRDPASTKSLERPDATQSPLKCPPLYFCTGLGCGGNLRLAG